ncbi:MAG TPA: nucleotide exchange factor GrpE [Clostridiales bacterium]|jgi:molecular chaperone GrpE|nr:nucleotide exchange factor GrpE [Clostridiales bacterium]
MSRPTSSHQEKENVKETVKQNQATEAETAAGPAIEEEAGSAAEADNGEDAGEAFAGTGASNGGTSSDEAAGENEDIQNQFMRLAADFQNYRRRVDKEKSEIFAFANEKIMTELLPVLDNFERSLAIGSDDVSHLDGMKLIHKQLIDVLNKNGLTEIKAEGENFDPDFHHAVMMENKEGFSEGQVTEVIQKGYLLNNKVIRPAMVKVAE